MSYLDVNGLGVLWTKIKNYISNQITTAVSTKADANHTHNYAGSSSAGGSATSAVKLDSSAGSETQPVYFSSGKPAACTYTLNKSVPSNAVFTDTNTKVTQTAVTASDYTNWRPLVIGSSNSGTEGFNPTTVTDTTFAVNTISCQPSSGTVKATTFKGNASTATKLATARTIGIDTGATGTATNFDGSGNITIPVTSVKEAYLSWGGKNFSGAYGPIDAAMVPDLGANRLAFMPAAGVEVQYSRDGGSTWSTYSTSDANKINLFNGNGAGHFIGADSATGIDKSNYQLRITITTNTAKVYTALNKFVIYCSTNGSSGSWCTIDAKTKKNVDSGTDTWVTFANKVSLSGWSGYNVINTSDITTYGNTSAQHQKLRFTFGVTSHPSSSSYAGLIIYRIMGFGGNGWTTPSTMAATGRMYTYDASQNVTFPAAVTATALYSRGSLICYGMAGEIKMWAGDKIPNGWLLCDGSEVSQTKYPNLYAAIGNLWGTPSNSSNFKLPNLTGRVPVGYNSADTDTTETFGQVGATGGARGAWYHTHTIGSSGAHNHASVGRVEGSGSGANIFESFNGASKTRAVNVPRSGNNGAHEHTPGSSGSSGNKLAVDKANMPPYAVVKYIICAI